MTSRSTASPGRGERDRESLGAAEARLRGREGSIPPPYYYAWTLRRQDQERTFCRCVLIFSLTPVIFRRAPVIIRSSVVEMRAGWWKRGPHNTYAIQPRFSNVDVCA